MKRTLEITYPGNKRVNVEIGEFLLKTDQSTKHGGDGTAPEPFDLFLASLASCAGIFALGFCQSRDLPTEGLALLLEWENTTKPPHQATAIYHLTLPNGFPEKYREGIIRAIDLCAVKRYLNHPPEFKISVK